MSESLPGKRKTRDAWPPTGDSRWRTDWEALVALPEFATVWLRTNGSPQPVRWRKPITNDLIETMGIYAWAPSAVTDGLSAREFQLFTGIARGLSVSEIASGVMYCSVKTASTYRSRVIEKTGLRNNAEIVVYALRHGLVTWGALPREAPAPEQKAAA
jgi:DNA-binding CsgD family transcriptional regulator